MREVLVQLQKQYAMVGDRISIRPGRQAIAAFVGKRGTIVAMFDAPRGSCVVHLDGDMNAEKTVFVYRDEMMINRAS